MFDFADLEIYEQLTFKTMRESGAAVAWSKLLKDLAAVPPEHPHYEHAKIAHIGWQLNIGELIFAKISERDQRRFFPLNDFCILPVGKQIVVKCSSLVREKNRIGFVFYYSKFRPTVEIEGRKYVVGFTQHVVEAIEHRLLFDRMSYAGLGEVYGYFELCSHFEPCKVWGDGERSNQLVDAITFYDDCSQDGFCNQNYVKEVLGASFDPANGKPYYRVGYCPVVLDGEFALAKTFLPPGFTKTPEYTTLLQSNVRSDERRRLKSMAFDGATLQSMINENDFSAVRWFHANGVPQVVRTDEEWFRPM
jgi:hypothetical protein